MEKKLRENFDDYIERANRFIKKGDLTLAFSHLEKAHIVGQKYVIPHAISHLYMLKIGFIKKDYREIIGQLLRLPLGILGSLVGIVPIGNTGGSNVSAFKRMIIPEDLSEIMREYNG